ncbi:MAG TPA: TonB family protein, partial [Bryobacteraceae bacterium]|nr:TonB family protein [Bryobacteraceae bacterium]
DSLEGLAVENFRSIEARGAEIGGLLFGTPDPDSPGKLRIDDFEPISCDYSRGPFYRLSDADLARLDAALEKRGGDAAARVAGFFRSHSRKGLALDAEDMKLMEARFRQPWQIALLVRPYATKVSSASIFFWEDAGMRGEAGYLEFPFRSSELLRAASPGEASKAAPAGDPSSAGSKTMGRPTVIAMPSRLKPPREVSAPDPAPPEKPVAAAAQEPLPAAPLPAAAKAVEAPTAAVEPPPAEPARQAAPPVMGPQKKLVWGGVAAALAACSGALFLYPGIMRRAPRATAALTLRIQHTATDLLLSWNRDSQAVQKAQKAVLSITDGDRHESLDMNLSDLRNGSIVYSPLTADVSFRMEVVEPDQSKVSESVRVLRTPAAPAPEKTAKAQPAAQPEPAAAEEPGPADAEAQDRSAAEKKEQKPAAVKRAPPRTFAVASLAERLRPALPTDLPVAPDVTTAAAAPVSLGALAPSLPEIARPTPAPAAAAPAPDPDASRVIRQPVLIKQVTPSYPDLARKQRISGTVSLSVVIGLTGQIRTAKVTSGPELLRSAAEDAVKQWLYSPMTVNGHAVETEKQIDVNFNLK